MTSDTIIAEGADVLKLRRAICPYQRCDWTKLALTRRGKKLLLDQHIAVCPHHPDEDPSIELTKTEMFACLYAPAGCPRMFPHGGKTGVTRTEAQDSQRVHALICEYRLSNPNQ